MSVCNLVLGRGRSPNDLVYMWDRVGSQQSYNECYNECYTRLVV